MIDNTIEDKNKFLENVEKLLDHTKNECVVVGDMWEDYSLENKHDQIIFKLGLEYLITLE